MSYFSKTTEPASSWTPSGSTLGPPKAKKRRVGRPKKNLVQSIPSTDSQPNPATNFQPNLATDFELNPATDFQPNPATDSYPIQDIPGDRDGPGPSASESPTAPLPIPSESQDGSTALPSGSYASRFEFCYDFLYIYFLSLAKVIRTRYSATQKKKIAEYARFHGCRAAARHFKIHHRNAERWLKEELHNTRHRHRPRYVNKKGQGRKISYPSDLELELLQWVLEKRIFQSLFKH